MTVEHRERARTRRRRASAQGCKRSTAPCPCLTPHNLLPRLTVRAPAWRGARRSSAPPPAREPSRDLEMCGRTGCKCGTGCSTDASLAGCASFGSERVALFELVSRPRAVSRSTRSIEHAPGTDPAKDPVHEVRALPGALPGGERRARSRARPTRARKAGET
eukprot:scaffold12704_cov53-Phaeocystis_antarctica.AAC.1